MNALSMLNVAVMDDKDPKKGFGNPMMELSDALAHYTGLQRFPCSAQADYFGDDVIESDDEFDFIDETADFNVMEDSSRLLELFSTPEFVLNLIHAYHNGSDLVDLAAMDGVSLEEFDGEIDFDDLVDAEFDGDSDIPVNFDEGVDMGSQIVLLKTGEAYLVEMRMFAPSDRDTCPDCGGAH